jgi:PTH1 family peptidyl-tRNA hydrolase
MVKMKLVVGLGNSGPHYQNNRHNIGFMANDYIIKCYAAEKYAKKHHSIIFSGRYQSLDRVSETILVAYPQTLMNNSGHAVHALLSYYKVPLNDILVICDDFDLPLGKIRLREKGSAGTHNGLKSILREIGSEFPRLRIGIGPLPPRYDVSSFVLGDFTVTEKEDLHPILTKVTHTTEQWLTDPFVKVQQFANSQ